MKFILPFLSFLLFSLSLKSQSPELWGVAEEGGIYEGGTLFSLRGDGSDFQKRYDFEVDAGSNPRQTKLTVGGDGYLYGLISDGGKYSDGVIFRFKTSLGFFERLYELQNYPDSFFLSNHQDGKRPYGSLIKINGSSYYGLTPLGGAENEGVLFSYDAVSDQYTVHVSFHDDEDTFNIGKQPYGSLTEAFNGSLYGMTKEGGTGHDNGLIFKLNPLTNNYQVVFEFADTLNGRSPMGDLLRGGDEKLFGTTPAGGENGKGVLFRLNTSTNGFTKLIDFGGDKGSSPVGFLTQNDSGKIYGLTSEGGEGFGTIFECDPEQSVFITAYAFDSTKMEGTFPLGGMTLASNGLLYGMTHEGGLYDKGVLYVFDPMVHAYSKLIDFDGMNGAFPEGLLTEAPDGWLYGMTTSGGSEDEGILFKFNPQSLVFIKLFEFHISDHGSFPESVIEYTDGSIYGITREGGNFHAGIMYHFDKTANDLDELFEFREELDKCYLPRETMTIGNDGKIYGVSLWHYDGGGSIFNYDPATGNYDSLVQVGFALGENPNSGLLQLQNGKMIGTMSRGGTFDFGVIYLFDPASLNYQVVYDFIDELQGGHPMGRLVPGNDGKIYGTADAGGNNGNGVIFSFDPDQMVYQKLFDFDHPASGEGPRGLIKAGNGSMYGFTHDGGLYSGGIFYSFDPQTQVFTKLLDFNELTTGGSPDGAPLLAADGNFYGCNTEGGANDVGTIFKYLSTNGSVSVIHHFDGTDGRIPHGELMEYIEPSSVQQLNAEIQPPTVSPIPAHGVIYINYLNPEKTGVRYCIINILGKKLLQGHLLNGESIISIADLPAGYYTVQFSDEENRVIINKSIVIQ